MYKITEHEAHVLTYTTTTFYPTYFVGMYKYVSVSRT